MSEIPQHILAGFSSKFCTDVHGAESMNPHDFADPALPVVPPC